MRHRIATVITVVITALLLLAAAGWAWHVST
jgi:hypothetical protein